MAAGTESHMRMDDMAPAKGRVFLFLQGPHGPFFRQLAGRLAAAGAHVLRVAYNAADEAEWGDAGPLLRFAGRAEDYPGWLADQLRRHGVSDLVLYGEARPHHAEALRLARAAGLGTHLFEEGYLRPRWITYERLGTNAHAPITALGNEVLRARWGVAHQSEPAPGPAIWGDSRQHKWHSLRYHLRLLIPARRYPGYRGHRAQPVRREVGWYLRRLLASPAIALVRAWRRLGLARAGRPFHLVLLQLSFDSAVQSHSRYRTNRAFVADCLDAFAEAEAGRGAGGGLLVFKAHPFEDGREGLGRFIRQTVAARGLTGRVVFLDGGARLAWLLDRARSVITINSTGAQQALWRGLPVKALGAAVYSRPGLVSEQPLSAFFDAPEPPDPALYRAFRRGLLASSQIPGSFYARAGIKRACDTLLARVLAREAADPAADPSGEPPPPESAMRHAAE